ncbi:MAG TPA: hypothetical protein VLZ81_14595 [Blastocatellia bacterium]|nr:hypothetical protein [Blastocatellia bacterium]
MTCESYDAAGLWAREGLMRRGLEPFELLTPESLAHGLGWSHRIHNGSVSTDLTFPDGRRLPDAQVRGILNRLTFVFPETLSLIRREDRRYVATEVQALLLSWLHGLPAPVLNRPTPLGLSGRMRHASEWVWLASEAGLSNQGYRQTSTDQPLPWDISARLAPNGVPGVSVIVAGDSVFGASVPQEIAAGCIRLARLAGADLFGIDFAVTPENGWTLAGVTTSPDLRLGGEALLDALASRLLENPPNPKEAQ